ncbi:MAG: hypothetical protein CMN30_25105 [Sandaracinus sp.]|nr:hypothetical protein [Sandaracinus sp.]
MPQGDRTGHDPLAGDVDEPKLDCALIAGREIVHVGDPEPRDEVLGPQRGQVADPLAVDVDLDQSELVAGPVVGQQIHREGDALIAAAERAESPQGDPEEAAGKGRHGLRGHTAARDPGVGRR